MAYRKAQLTKRISLWRLALYVVILVLLAYAVTSEFDHFRRGVSVLLQAKPAAALVGLGLTVLTFFLAAAIYIILALKPLRYKRTLGVEIAAAFVNRLLPAGIGGLGLHGDYLHRQKHTVPEATAVVSVNNALGMVGHLLLLTVFIVLWPHRVAVRLPHISVYWLIIAVGVLVVLFIILWQAAGLRRRIVQFWRNFAVSLSNYARRPQKLVGALGSTMLLTLTYVAALQASAVAVGVSLPYSSVFIIFTIGTLIGTATPTPGGLVGVEAGLFAGFSTYDVPAAPALAAVFLYRLLTYWLPLLPGLFALLAIRHKRLV